MPTASPEPRYDVFISYRRGAADELALLLQTQLQNQGVTAFLDRDLRRGVFDDTLLCSIAESPTFLIILTPHALDRCSDEEDWLRKEIVQAISNKRNIIPLQVDSFQFTPEVVKELDPAVRDLSRYQAVEYSRAYFASTIERIVKIVEEDKAERKTAEKPMIREDKRLVSERAGAEKKAGEKLEAERQVKEVVQRPEKEESQRSKIDLERLISEQNSEVAPERPEGGITKTRAPKRSAKWWVAVFGIGVLATSLAVSGPALFKLVFGANQPTYLQGIVKGNAVGTCAAENSGVQPFEHGWLVAQFLPTGTDHFYAIIDKGNSGLNWFKIKSDRREGLETECQGIPGEKLMRWGFRWWYCSKDAKPIRESLGQPITLETASWIQYQRWSAGLLLVGIPDLTEKDFNAGKWPVMINAFLEDAQQQNQGWGRLSKIAPENISNCKVYCNAVWYYARYAPTEQGTDKTNGMLLKEPGCTKRHTHTDIEFIKPRPVCSLCLE